MPDTVLTCTNTCALPAPLLRPSREGAGRRGEFWCAP